MKKNKRNRIEKPMNGNRKIKNFLFYFISKSSHVVFHFHLICSINFVLCQKRHRVLNFVILCNIVIIDIARKIKESLVVWIEKKSIKKARARFKCLTLVAVGCCCIFSSFFFLTWLFLNSKYRVVDDTFLYILFWCVFFHK